MTGGFVLPGLFSMLAGPNLLDGAADERAARFFCGLRA